MADSTPGVSMVVVTGSDVKDAYTKAVTDAIRYDDRGAYEHGIVTTQIFHLVDVLDYRTGKHVAAELTRPLDEPVDELVAILEPLIGHRQAITATTIRAEAGGPALAIPTDYHEWTFVWRPREH